jgi:hypothetical protein
MRWRFVFLSVLVMDAFPALAEGPSLTENYGAWTALSGASRAAYAAGAFDMLALSGGSPEDLAALEDYPRAPWRTVLPRRFSRG